MSNINYKVDKKTFELESNPVVGKTNNKFLVLKDIRSVEQPVCKENKFLR